MESCAFSRSLAHPRLLRQYLRYHHLKKKRPQFICIVDTSYPTPRVEIMGKISQNVFIVEKVRQNTVSIAEQTLRKRPRCASNRQLRAVYGDRELPSTRQVNPELDRPSKITRTGWHFGRFDISGQNKVAMQSLSASMPVIASSHLAPWTKVGVNYHCQWPLRNFTRMRRNGLLRGIVLARVAHTLLNKSSDLRGS